MTLRSQMRHSTPAPRPASFLAVVVGMALLALTAACGSGSPAPTAAASNGPVKGASPQLVKAAQKEGQLVFYSVVLPEADQRVATAFQRAYGIKTRFIRLADTQLAQRYSAEAQSGASAADVVLSGNTAFVSQSEQKGWMTTLTKAGVPGYPGTFPAKFLRPQAGTAVVQLEPSGIAYNTQAVPKAQAPKQWTDLLNPHWKGKILLVDPTSAPPYTDFWYVIQQKYGTGFLSKLRGQVSRLYPGAVPVTQALAAGEGAIAVPDVPAVESAAAAKGAPLSFAQPDLTTGPEVVVGMSAHAPHPNAARLFAAFLLSAEGIKLLNQDPGSASPLQSSLPAEYTSVNHATAVTQQNAIYQAFGVKG